MESLFASAFPAGGAAPQAAAAGASLRAQTKAALQRMLTVDGDAVWKVLVYDDVGRTVLSPVLTVADLRDAGVTVHMELASARQRIADVPAVYFVAPTAANIQRIADDLSRGLYDTFHLNFTTPLPRDLLEDLAQRCVTAGGADRVARVVDQHLTHAALDEHLFALIGAENALVTAHARNVSDARVTQLGETVAAGLFGVCATLGVVPYIRYTRGNAAEMCATLLDAKLRDACLTPRNGLFDDASRATLIVLDRHLDHTPMLAHSWLYAALVHDVCNLRLNRISVMVEGEKGAPAMKKTFDLDADDYFWRQYAGSPFPEVAEQVDLELNKYKKDAQDVLATTGASSIEEMNQLDLGLNPKQLKSAITQLPALTARKRVIDMHMHVATALLKSIQSHGLDVLFETEQQRLTRAIVTDVLRDPKRHPDDKVRLLGLYYLLEPSAHQQPAASSTGAGQQQPQEDLAQIIAQMHPDAKYVGALNFIKKQAAAASGTGAGTRTSGTPSFTPLGGGPAAAASPAAGSSDLFGRINKLTENLAQGTLPNLGTLGSAYSTLVSTVGGGVRQLMTGSRMQPLAVRAATAAIDGHDDPVDMGVLDPKQVRRTHAAPTPAGTRAATGPVIIFVVGGGNYLELHSLLEVGRNKKRTVIYGATELLNSQHYLEQLTQLGSQ